MHCVLRSSLLTDSVSSSEARTGRCRFSGPNRNGRYSWARYYHPGLQRFISEDPIGLAGGDPNLYAYVFNSPTDLRDPSGLAVDPVSLTAFAVFCGGGAVINVTMKYVLAGRKPTLGDAGWAARNAWWCTLRRTDRCVQASGRVMTQTDGAIVRILQTANGRFNVVIEGERGLITTFENLSQKSLDKLAKSYGWQ